MEVKTILTTITISIIVSMLWNRLFVTKLSKWFDTFFEEETQFIKQQQIDNSKLIIKYKVKLQRLENKKMIIHTCSNGVNNEANQLILNEKIKQMDLLEEVISDLEDRKRF